MKFYEIKPSAVERGFLDLQDRSLLLCAGSEASFDAESAESGGFGTFDNAPAAFLLLNPDRPITARIAGDEPFAICVFEKGPFRDSLTALGADRAPRSPESVGLTPAFVDGVPYCEEADIVFLCSRTHTPPFDTENTPLTAARIVRILRKKPGFKERLVGCC